MGARSHRSVTVVAAVGLASGLALAGCSSSSSKPSAGSSNSSSATGAASSASGSASGSAPGGGGTASGPALPDLSGKSIQVLAEWSGKEQQDFQKVIDAFTAKTHAKVSYQGAGDQTVTVLQSKIAGGGAPDVALIAAPGAITDLAKSGKLTPLSADVQSAIDANYDPGWKKLGTIDGKSYAIMFKAADKGTFWYNTAAFQQAGIQAPTDWASFIKDCQTLSDAGIAPVSVGGADGWTLADWFQNIYLSQAGPDMYDKLSHHQIPWTDPSVKQALTTLGQLFGNDSFLAGGKSGALQTSFDDSVTNTFKNPSKAAMVFEGDFSSSVITGTTSAKLGTDAKFFPFPAAGSTANAVQGAGDSAVALNNNPATMAFIQFLASPEAATIWAQAGGFLSPDKNVASSAYTDDISRAEAAQLTQAGPNFRFSLDDLSPAGFGGTKGAGEWGDLQYFLGHPSDVDGTAAKLEADAAKVTWS